MLAKTDSEATCHSVGDLDSLEAAVSAWAEEKSSI